MPIVIGIYCVFLSIVIRIFMNKLIHWIFVLAFTLTNKYIFPYFGDYS